MNQVIRVVGQLENFTEDLITRLTLEAVAQLVPDTPIDTGWARSNWVPSIGSSVDETTGTPENVSQAVQEAGLATVATQYRLPNTVFISNNVPYITRLNEGSSAQAPAGFVQNAIARAIREVI